MTEASLSALVVSIAERRDRAAFTSLFDHFAPQIKAHMVGCGASEELAEDLAQEALLVLWRRAPTYDPCRAAVATWIFTIARNLRITDWRKGMRSLCFDDPSMATIDPDWPDQILMAEHEKVRIGHAIEALSDKQAEAVRQVFFADKSQSDVANDLGLPLGTVKSRLRLAYMQLRVNLQNASD